MAAQPRSDSGRLFDVPLSPAYGNRAFTGDDVGFQDEEPPESPANTNPAERDYGAGFRRPIPVPTISQGMVPFTGLHLLSSLDRVEIQQTVELDDLLASVESENRYVVRAARSGPRAALAEASETLLVAAETSAQWQRCCLGSSRALRLRIYDPSRQETLHLRRRLACRLGLLGCCYLQAVDVLLPPGRPLGSVTQVWTLLVPVLEVRDTTGSVLYRVEGPSQLPLLCGSAASDTADINFKITSRDGLVELGGISHHWKAAQSSFMTSVLFPSADLDIHHKALLLAAAFLLEYMFFESAKKRSWLPSCCC